MQRKQELCATRGQHMFVIILREVSLRPPQALDVVIERRSWTVANELHGLTVPRTGADSNDARGKLIADRSNARYFARREGVRRRADGGAAAAGIRAD